MNMYVPMVIAGLDFSNQEGMVHGIGLTDLRLTTPIGIMKPVPNPAGLSIMGRSGIKLIGSGMTRLGIVMSMQFARRRKTQLSPHKFPQPSLHLSQHCYPLFSLQRHQHQHQHSSPRFSLRRHQHQHQHSSPRLSLHRHQHSSPRFSLRRHQHQHQHSSPRFSLRRHQHQHQHSSPRFSLRRHRQLRLQVSCQQPYPRLPSYKYRPFHFPQYDRILGLLSNFHSYVFMLCFLDICNMYRYTEKSRVFSQISFDESKRGIRTVHCGRASWWTCMKLQQNI